MAVTVAPGRAVRPARPVAAGPGRALVVGVAASVVLVVLAVLGLVLGDFPIELQRIPGILAGGGERIERTVVVDWRLTRVIAAVGVGALLGIAGALFQTVTRNPLASPDILGLSSGAFSGMLLTLVLVSASWQALVAGSLVGGLVTALVIQLLASRDGLQGFRIIVVGIGVSAMLASLNTWLLLQVELETAMFASAWGAGSLNGVADGPVAGALVAAVPIAAVAFCLVPRMRQLELGDDLAAATGARPRAVRALALLAGVGLVSAATTVAGPVAFVALAAPQVARRLARTPSLPLGLSALLGAVILLASDLVAQHALPAPLPVGVVTVSVGGVYLLSVIVMEIRRRA
ncbi:iron chelate uptake ABC transporter family permease subunit [Microbacterium sp. MM2322]|uniref:FecCD family ABC transporter permease n=1 Tax=Microbacterium sp. MM2322 TaxID=3157631 RepID=UPI0032D5AE8B